MLGLQSAWSGFFASILQALATRALRKKVALLAVFDIVSVTDEHTTSLEQSCARPQGWYVTRSIRKLLHSPLHPRALVVAMRTSILFLTFGAVVAFAPQRRQLLSPATTQMTTPAAVAPVATSRAVHKSNGRGASSPRLHHGLHAIDAT